MQKGIILLCFGALITILFFIFGAGLFSLMVAFLFLLCGFICLHTHQRTGLWCGCAAYLFVDLYLRYATGITWGIIWLTAQFTPEMNYMRLATGWGQFLVCVLLLVLTLWSYRKKTASCDKKHMAFAGVGLLLLVGLTLGQNGILRFILLRPNFHEALYQNLSFWVHTCGDYIRLWLLAMLLVLGDSLIQQRRLAKKHNIWHLRRLNFHKAL